MPKAFQNSAFCNFIFDMIMQNKPNYIEGKFDKPEGLQTIVAPGAAQRNLGSAVPTNPIDPKGVEQSYRIQAWKTLDKFGGILDKKGAVLDNFGNVLAHFGAVWDTFGNTFTHKSIVFWLITTIFDEIHKKYPRFCFGYCTKLPTTTAPLEVLLTCL